MESTVTVLHGEIRVISNVAAYPNPVIGAASVTFEVEGDVEAVSVSIYNLAGELVSKLSAPSKQVSWNLMSGNRPVSNGVYVVLVEAIDAQGTRDRRSVRVVVLQ